MRVGFLKCHLYCPCQIVGHFSHTQCIQSMLPSIPGNPLSSALASRSDMTFALGVLRYVDQETFTIVRVNSLNFSCIVLSPMWKYSSNPSTSPPYASMRSAAVTFCTMLNWDTPAAFVLLTKYKLFDATSWHMSMNISLHIRNLSHTS
jgi:hypothetical protein